MINDKHSIIFSILLTNTRVFLLQDRYAFRGGSSIDMLLLVGGEVPIFCVYACHCCTIVALLYHIGMYILTLGTYVNFGDDQNLGFYLQENLSSQFVLHVCPQYFNI